MKIAKQYGVQKAWGKFLRKTNVNGGGIALGHPFTLAQELLDFSHELRHVRRHGLAVLVLAVGRAPFNENLHL